MIAVQPYIDTVRKVDLDGQRYVDTHHQLILTDTEIKSRDYRFALENVFDISYRPVREEVGLLYLHTNQGVFTYRIATPPDQFIVACKKVIGC